METETKLYIRLNLFLLLIFWLYIILSLVSNNAVLADDLSLAYKGVSLKNENISFIKFLKNFIDSSTMTSRPVSGFFTAIIIYLSKYCQHFYFLSYIFFPAGVFSIYFVFNRISKNAVISLLIAILYSLSVIGNAVQFSPIMLNSNIATIFYVFSIYFLSKNNSLKYLIFSGFLFILSILSYEIFLPLFVINLFFISKNKTRFIYLAGVFSVIFFYRNIVEPNVFKNYYHRESISNILNFGRSIKMIIFSFKLLFRDIFMGIYRGFCAVKYYSAGDYVILVLFNISQIYLLKKYQFNLTFFNKKKLLICLLGVILSFSIFFFSTYKPTLFGFENRNLGSVRLFISILLVLFSAYIITRFKLSKTVTIALFCLFIIPLSICLVSIKNAWIFANKFNVDLFSNIVKKLPENPATNKIYIKYDFDFPKKDDHFIFREPLFYNQWEASYLLWKNGYEFPENLNIKTSKPEDNQPFYFYDNDSKKLEFIISK